MEYWKLISGFHGNKIKQDMEIVGSYCLASMATRVICNCGRTEHGVLEAHFWISWQPARSISIGKQVSGLYGNQNDLENWNGIMRSYCQNYMATGIFSNYGRPG